MSESNQNFTVHEKEGSLVGAFKIVWRFIWSLKLLRFTFFPSLLFTILASVFPQMFLWMTGKRVECGDGIVACTIEVIGYKVDLSIGMISLVLLSSMFLRFISWIAFESAGQWSSQDVHKELTKGLSKVRVTYYDENPSGRILNRVVGDFNELRTRGVVRVGDFIQGLVEVFSVALLVMISSAWAAFLIIPALLAFLYIQSKIAPMAQRAGILLSIRRGELLHRETDLIEGAQVFALYGKESSLGNRMASAVTSYGQLSLLKARIETWGRFWTSNVSTLYSALSILLIALSAHHGIVSLVLAAALISVVGRVGPAFNWLSWTTMYLSSSVAHARRIFEIVDLPDETSEELSTERSPAVESRVTFDTHLRGDLEFQNFKMSYRKDTPHILHGLSLKIPFGRRVGIIGRTGAGKSSLVQSLYRMVHVHEGDIKVNNTSLYRMEIRYARSLFGVVPQDPYLFEGTVRSNLDPVLAHSDAVLKEALLKAGFPFELDAELVEGGKNLSLGERQLLCLARILLSPAPFIIMDEPTSGIDPITDAKIQNLLRTAFNDKTVITIAHRLDTLEKYDWIYEMKDGVLLREGRPEDLLGLNQSN